MPHVNFRIPNAILYIVVSISHGRRTYGIRGFLVFTWEKSSGMKRRIEMKNKKVLIGRSQLGELKVGRLLIDKIHHFD